LTLDPNGNIVAAYQDPKEKTMTIYIYARVSTKEQNLEQQVAFLKDEYPKFDKVYSEAVTGKDMDREQWLALLAVVKANDTIIVKELSRIGRSTIGVINATKHLDDLGVNIIINKEKIDTTTPTGRFTLTVLAGMAQMERELMLERQAVGIATAKKAGKYTGRKAQTDKCEKAIEYMKDKNLSAKDAATLAKVGVSTLYRYINKVNP
jgi:DNA invertase Pin-like site-specific DNA recombinase